MIIGVAIKLKCGEEIRLPKPNRHHDCVNLAYEKGFDSRVGGKNQGFYDDQGNYLTRKEAMIYVKKIGQERISRLDGEINNGNYLFSEDLW